MSKKIKKILVVGGGTAGWITASLIAAEHRCVLDDAVEVVLIESPTVSPIGVGEGTWPTMRNTLKKLGISESEFLIHCEGSFKQASKFVGWRDGHDAYYHPFSIPAHYLTHNLSAYWQDVRKKISFGDALSAQARICEKNLAPKQIATPEFAGVLNYGYHLDSAKFSEFVKRHAQKNLGVTFICDDVIGVETYSDGDVRAVRTTHSGDVSADLFVDCTGFSSLLIGQHFKVDTVDVKNTLFADTALAVQVPYNDDDSCIASHTISTAKSAGWVWDIGLPTRRGVGYVYSSGHSSDTAAESELAEYVESIGGSLDKLSPRKIKINSGYRKTPWVRNCVAVGLAAGFVEPLEASSLVLVELAAKMISEELPVTREAMEPLAKKYNLLFNYRWERIVDFLKLHYVLSSRADSGFWRDNRAVESVPDSLQDLLKVWMHRPPSHEDFLYRDEIFTAASYQYVLYGMGFTTALPAYRKKEEESRLLVSTMEEMELVAARIRCNLDSNRVLLQKVKAFGFSKI